MPNLYQVFRNSTNRARDNNKLLYCPQCGTAMGTESLPELGRQRCATCAYVHYMNPTPGVTVLIRSSEGKILIGKRVPQARYGNRWCLPGGYIEFEESFIEAAHREVLEETGVRIVMEGIVNVVSNHLDDVHHTLVIVLLATLAEGIPQARDDLSELQWIDRERHQGIPYAFEADRRIIDRYFAGNMPLLPIDKRIAPPSAQNPCPIGDTVASPGTDARPASL